MIAFLHWLVFIKNRFDVIELFFHEECHAKNRCDGDFGRIK